MSRDPHTVIRHRYVTEKAKVLEQLKNCESNPSVRKCEAPKYVFKVDLQATKRDIASAIEAIYPGVRVTAVNTIRNKAKKRRVRGRVGFTKRQKKAIVTLTKGDSLGSEEEE